jgi:hypothetical protein
MVPMADTDTEVHEEFTTSTIARCNFVDYVTTAGNGHDDELEQNSRDIADLDIDAPKYATQHAELLAERRRLQALPSEGARTEQIVSDDTVRERWLSLSITAERRALLIDRGIRVTASREHGVVVDHGDARFWWPHDDGKEIPAVEQEEEHAVEEARAAEKQRRDDRAAEERYRMWLRDNPDEPTAEER